MMAGTINPCLCVCCPFSPLLCVLFLFVFLRASLFFSSVSPFPVFSFFFLSLAFKKMVMLTLVLWFFLLRLSLFLLWIYAMLFRPQNPPVFFSGFQCSPHWFVAFSLIFGPPKSLVFVCVLASFPPSLPLLCSALPFIEPESMQKPVPLLINPWAGLWARDRGVVALSCRIFPCWIGLLRAKRKGWWIVGSKQRHLAWKKMTDYGLVPICLKCINWVP